MNHPAVAATSRQFVGQRLGRNDEPVAQPDGAVDAAAQVLGHVLLWWALLSGTRASLSSTS